MSKYIRTAVKTFSELTARQTVCAREILGEDAEESLWVEDPVKPHGALPLANFMRANSKLWDGYWGMSYFSAYFIKLSSNQQQAVVGYRHR